jgi:hypothetical protein
MRDGGAAALASGCSAVEARHLGGRAGLVDENELLGIEIKLDTSKNAVLTADLKGLLAIGQ